ncbi:MAG: AvaI/BsoBI family type II restriction endonuclease [Planctomycetota bacterium]|nr:AvaI/BsoBI family type II restriction endonuclease [Planctomycetota bacterium]
MNKPYLKHLSDSKDLVTPYEATRAGFVSLALERNRRATPFIEQARSLKSFASAAKNPKDLLNIKEINSALLCAAGVSDKASSHLEDKDKIEAINGLIKNFLELAGAKFVEELVYRFLLTKGDTLGGSMRNVGGILGQRKFARAIISALAITKTPFYWLNTKSNTWVKANNDDADIELFLRGINWKHTGRKRTALFNLTAPMVKNNIDFCLLNCDYKKVSIDYKKPELYISCGELKGGIDPTGADEHWKTANTALSRIRKAFSNKRLSLQTFFIGAAIEKKMAGEIWEQLKDGMLTNAANLTNHDQVNSLCNWLIKL